MLCNATGGYFGHEQYIAMYPRELQASNGDSDFEREDVFKHETAERGGDGRCADSSQVQRWQGTTEAALRSPILPYVYFYILLVYVNN